jgi:hypothetical protein
MATARAGVDPEEDENRRQHAIVYPYGVGGGGIAPFVID